MVLTARGSEVSVEYEVRSCINKAGKEAPNNRESNCFIAVAIEDGFHGTDCLLVTLQTVTEMVPSGAAGEPSA